MDWIVWFIITTWLVGWVVLHDLGDEVVVNEERVELEDFIDLGEFVVDVMLS